MSTVTLTNRDVSVRDAVQRQLEWDPAVEAGALGVSAKGGTVTLTGYIDTYAGKLAAERAAADAPGIVAIENRIIVEPAALDVVPDDMC